MLVLVLCQFFLLLNVLGGIEIVLEDVVVVCQWLEQEDLIVLVYCFEGDCFCCVECFVVYVQVLGFCFVVCVLFDSVVYLNLLLFFVQYVFCLYSVVIVYLIDVVGELMLVVCDEILVFFWQCLS